MHRVTVLDTHTGGEPTRVVLDGFVELAGATVAEKCESFRRDADRWRRAVVCEPRGSDVLVAAVLVEPADAGSAAGVIFCNTAGPLGMCGHGTIGVAVALHHLGRIAPGTHRLETPVGPVSFTLHVGRRVSLENVPARVHARGVELPLGGRRGGTIRGDVAWGGNWFFLADAAGRDLSVDNAGALLHATGRIRAALVEHGVTGAGGAEIDHVELCGPPHDPANHGRNFVLCPGGAYDRSPCGTGTSAKLACLAAAGTLDPGETWRQESVTGSLFEASYRPGEYGAVVPTITGEAFVTGENTLLLDPGDPLCWGF